MANVYDIIGDLHGNAAALKQLLTKMGYRQRDGIWGHPERQAIFVGDFVDIGPQQVETVTVVRQMVESGTALAVLGNHDLNAIAWYLPDPANPGDHLRSHFSSAWGQKNRHQHSAFLAEVEEKPELHREIIEWFLTLPLWLDLPGLRVVHACWHPPSLAYLSNVLGPGARLSKELMPLASQESGAASPQPSVFSAVEALTKGIEIPLPAGNSFADKYGIPRTSVRVRWWENGAKTYQTAALLHEDLRQRLSNAPIPEGASFGYHADLPVFIGHYWLTGDPTPLTPNVACVDYSVGHGGPLCAYRWQGEAVLEKQNFCVVDPS